MKKMNESLSFLIEGELERAEVIIAAKAITDDLQDMAVKVAKMEAEDVMPMTDALTTNFSIEQSRQFSDSVGEALRGLAQKITEVRNAVSDQIARLEGNENGEPFNDLTATADSDEVPAADGDATGDEEIDWGADDAAPADDTAGNDDEALDAFPDDISDTQHAAGRARKESIAPKKKPILEADRALANEFAKLLREGVSTSQAVTRICTTYMLTPSDLLSVVKKAR